MPSTYLQALDVIASMGVTKSVPGPAKKTIKLCTIDPGNKYDIIACTLTKATLDISLSYKCLSYVWGSQEDKVPILLDGEDHAVTRNLHAALNVLRRTEFHGSIWIDALCIDQKDDKEKREQVAMMDNIFRGAE